MLNPVPHPFAVVRSRVVTRRLAPLVVSALLLSACVGAGDPPDPDTSPSPGSEAQPTPASGSVSPPIRIVPELATSRAAVVDVGRDGATLTADDGAGTSYVLEIPPNALPATVQVSLTPVASVSGLPDGVDWHFGVEFAPSGLRLALPALLTIRRADIADVADVEFVGFHGPDRDVYLTEGFVQPGQAVLQIAGFSGRGGVGCSGPCARSGLAPLPPVDPTTAYESAREAARRAALDLQRRGWEGEHVGDEIWNEVIREFERAFETLSEQCRESGDLDEIYTSVLRTANLVQIAQLIGIDDAFGDLDPLAMVDDCVRFEFELDSRFEDGDGAVMLAVEHLYARFPLRRDHGVYVGEAPFEIREAYLDRPGLGCVVGLQPDVITNDEPLPVQVLAMTFVFGDSPDGEVKVIDAEVLLDPGWVYMHQTEPCEVENVTITDQSSHAYVTGWDELHDDEFEQVSTFSIYWRIAGWDIRSGEVVAEKRYQRSEIVNTVPLREDTTLRILLAPRDD